MHVYCTRTNRSIGSESIPISEIDVTTIICVDPMISKINDLVIRVHNPSQIRNLVQG